MNIYDISKADESKMEDFLESSMYDPDEMYDEVTQYAESIKRKDLKKIVLKILNDPEVSNRIRFWPAAEIVHHEFRSGLIQHILEMLTVMDAMKRFYPDADYDILTTGIIIHDLGKIFEFEFNGIKAELSKVGVLVGHIVKGVQIFDEFGAKTLNEDVYLHVVHLILSHHGKREMGSPVVPATLEAIMLTKIDDLSAKSRTADSARLSLREDQMFTNRNLWLENAKIWKGTNSSEEEFQQDEIPEEIIMETKEVKTKSNPPSDDGLPLF
jgi:3'-5' exoribonuclease